MSSEATRMAETHPAAEADRFEVRVTADSHFGWIRTRLSLERTMMAWVRTATALIGFGFAIVQYLDRLQQLPDTRPAYLPNAPQCLGLALIACGILALVVSLRQYFWTARYLSEGAFAPIARMKAEGMQSPVVAIALLLICIGLFAFFAVLLRLA
jgi:putative membrane protein